MFLTEYMTKNYKRKKARKIKIKKKILRDQTILRKPKKLRKKIRENYEASLM